MSTNPNDPGESPFASPQRYDDVPLAHSAEGDATGGLIPYKNPPALIGYYFGIFSLIPGLGLVLGAIGVRILGFPKQTWWKAVLGLAGLHILCRWVTPEQENINLAFAIWPGCESLFPSHLAYVSTLTALCLVVFAGVEFAMRKTGFARLPRQL